MYTFSPTCDGVFRLWFAFLWPAAAAGRFIRNKFEFLPLWVVVTL